MNEPTAGGGGILRAPVISLLCTDGFSLGPKRVHWATCEGEESGTPTREEEGLILAIVTNRRIAVLDHIRRTQRTATQPSVFPPLADTDAITIMTSIEVHGSSELPP